MIGYWKNKKNRNPNKKEINLSALKKTIEESLKAEPKESSKDLKDSKNNKNGIISPGQKIEI